MDKNKRVAREIIMYWVCEAWHDLDNDHYKESLRPSERKAILRYIHKYGMVIGCLLRVRYKPNQ